MSWLLERLSQPHEPMAEDAPAAAPGAAGASNNNLDPAVAELEADLQSSFDAMAMEETAANDTASPLKQLRAGIKNVVKQQAILKHGFLGEHHFEQEGSDALLFDDVPPWITYARISGYRYRQITSVADPDDEFELYNEHVVFYGVPGASGWADSIGDVAIHYLGPKWAVFSKVFPFHEQTEAREAHEDVLLLGSTRHVMLTPHCAYRIGADGLTSPSTEVTCLLGDGGLPRTALLSRTPVEVTRRLYLTWGHLASDYAAETSGFEFDLQAVVSTPETLGHQARRLVGSLVGRIANGGRHSVQEHWMRYPGAPLEPSYYAQLLATAASMTEEEQRTRAMMEPRETPRGDRRAVDGSAVTVAVGDPLAFADPLVV